MINLETIDTVSLYAIPGMSFELSVDGYFVKQGNAILPDTGQTKALERGFVVSDTAVGTIDPSDDNDAKVIYTHKRPETNTIWFFALTGEIGRVMVIAVPIHDHSSIVQGGPAYGTYFSDDNVE